MISLLCGSRNSGKTMLLEKLYSAVKERNDKSISGLLLIKANNGEYYNALDLQSGITKIFCEKKKDSQFGYVFIQDGLNLAYNAIANSLDSDIILIDELGRLELEGGGIAESFEKALESQSSVIATVGIKNLTKVINKWKLNCKVINIDELGFDKALELLITANK